MLKVLSLIFLLLIVQVGFAQSQKARINHTAIFVKDIKVSTDFYEHIIGLTKIDEPFKDGKHTWFETGPKMAMHIIEGATERKEYYRNQHTCFSLQSVEGFTEILKKNKIQFEDISGKQGAISSRPDGVKQIWLRDPDGYWIEINDAKE
ncbi:MAG: VOC family protein [Cyclobacteriaceae bacterium]|nr:VOC family protein [Cyclobacteriaceae bacterium]